ncbi:hypothetical protein MA16_Dca021350 [Dendrobium catenatum]|uniref:Uncharacterized protein n=1 Tax=Dendrobium catenatum TaxID=906689 RepID=A0A2I0X6Q4_9ASPA|nr:hypothetical protein MA16_Dca021350 [Dendrobium catenatum]
MSVTIELNALFRDRGAFLTHECLSRMGRFTSEAQGRVTFKFKWLDMCTRDLTKSWASAFFFVKNDWGLIEKWGKLRDLPFPLHVGEEDIKRILKAPDVVHLLYEVCYLNRYIEEEFLFRFGLSVHAGRSDDQKTSAKKIIMLEAENKRSHTLIAEKDAALTSLEFFRVIEDFKKYIAFKIVIQVHVQEARDHIYEIELKALEK